MRENGRMSVARAGGEGGDLFSPDRAGKRARDFEPAVILGCDD